MLVVNDFGADGAGCVEELEDALGPGLDALEFGFGEQALWIGEFEECGGGVVFERGLVMRL